MPEKSTTPFTQPLHVERTFCMCTTSAKCASSNWTQTAPLINCEHGLMIQRQSHTRTPEQQCDFPFGSVVLLGVINNLKHYCRSLEKIHTGIATSQGYRYSYHQDMLFSKHAREVTSSRVWTNAHRREMSSPYRASSRPTRAGPSYWRKHKGNACFLLLAAFKDPLPLRKNQYLLPVRSTADRHYSSWLQLQALRSGSWHKLPQSKGQ
jgi:hypothetical protein